MLNQEHKFLEYVAIIVIVQSKTYLLQVSRDLSIRGAINLTIIILFLCCGECKMCICHLNIHMGDKSMDKSLCLNTQRCSRWIRSIVNQSICMVICTI